MGHPSLAEVITPSPAAAPAVPPVAGLERLWRETRGHPEVAIAVLDGPADLSHPCFQGARLEFPGLAGAARESGPIPDGLAALHGTHVASLLFGRPGSAVAGIAPDCRGLIVPVFRTDSSGAVIPCSQLDLARAVTRAVLHGARLINVSGGELDAGGEPQPALRDALALCVEHDVLIVAAAGNDGCECLHLPAADSRVLVVGAMDAGGEPLSLSNWPDAYRDHGLLAPGEGIVGAVPGGGTMALTGTSFATAIVSGVAALLMSVQRLRSGRSDAGAVRRALLDTAVGCDEQPATDCRRILSGRLNVAGALARIISGCERKGTGTLADPVFAGVEHMGREPVPFLSHALNDPHFTREARTTMSEHNFEDGQPVHEAVESRISSYLENGARAEAPPAASRLPQFQPPAVERTSSTARRSPAATDDKPLPAQKGTCGCGAKTRTLIYALGQIDYDFGTEANRDSFLQQGLPNPADPTALLAHLEANPWAAESIVWILVRETTPVYAIRPSGPFAGHVYDRLREFLHGQLTEGVSQVSVPGVEAGEVTLLNGQTVPVVAPDLRGMYSWSTPALVKAVLGSRPRANGKQADYDRQSAEIANFLDRVYYELSNLGVTPRDRAINYAATNAWQAAQVYQRALQEHMKLDTITAERSRVCRPGADCWDVLLTFFDPARRQERARVVHRFTVDVSEAMPVTVGAVRSWDVY